MSQQTGGYPPAPATGATFAPSTAGQPDTGQATTQVARDEARDVGRTAAGAGRQVAGTAAEQAGHVAQEVKTQARDLVGEARGQVQDQARTGQRKAVDGIRALGEELRQMADTGQSGPASEIARQAAGRVDDLAVWLGQREPAELLDEVRSLARRRPGAFLVGMALAGVVVGRLTRGAVDSARADSARPAPSAYPRAAVAPPAPVAPRRTFDGPVGAPAGRSSAPSDVPTPPQGNPLPRPYAPDPVGAPDTFAGPGGRHATGDLDPTPERRDPALSERLDDPFRPGETR